MGQVLSGYLLVQTRLNSWPDSPIPGRGGDVLPEGVRVRERRLVGQLQEPGMQFGGLAEGRVVLLAMHPDEPDPLMGTQPLPSPRASPGRPGQPRGRSPVRGPGPGPPSPSPPRPPLPAPAPPASQRRPAWPRRRGDSP